MHMRYTAREGGGLLRNGALKNLKDLIASAQAAGSARLFSTRHEFPGEWAKFQSQASDPAKRFELTLNLRKEHYPYWSQGRLNAVTRVDIVVRSAQSPVPGSIGIADKLDRVDAPGNPPANKDSLTKDAAMGNLLIGKLTNIALPAQPDAQQKLFFDVKEMSDLWIAVTWSE